MPTSSSSSYDLIIVGAGPAGATAALFAERAGLRALLLDKETFPRDKICGDALSGKAVTVLRELGLQQKVADLPGAAINTVTFSSPEHVRIDIDLTRSDRRDYLTGYVIQRRIFDHFLFNEARRAAADTLEGFTVKDVLRDNGAVTGVSGVDADGTAHTFHAPIVLGAGGFNCVVARKLGLYRHEPKHWIVALRCYYRGVRELTDQIELHFVDEVIPGYFWIFPVDGDRANIGIGMVHDAIKSQDKDLRVCLRNAIESPAFRDRFEGAEPLEEPVGWNLPVGSLHRRNHGAGFMLLGDAAGLIDPFTGEGIGNAFFSAKFAVDAAKQAHEAGDFSERFLKRYDDALWDAIGDELAVSTRLQKIGRYRPLLNYVIRKAASSQETRDVIMGMIADTIPKKQLTNPLFYMKLLFK